MTDVRDPLAGLLITPAGDESAQVPAGAEMDFLVPAFADIDQIRKTLVRPAILPLGILRAQSVDAAVLAPTLNAYIAPEIVRRHEQDPHTWPLPHALRQALIALSPFAGGPSRVYLNDEVAIIASARTKYGTLRAGDPVTLDNVVDLRGARFRDVDITTEPFLWLRVGPRGSVTLYFSFGPAVPHAVARLTGSPGDLTEAHYAEWLAALSRTIEDVIAQDILQQWFEAELPDDKAVRAAMLADGWFPAPCLLPHPWRAMCAAYSNDAPLDASRLAVEAVTPAKLQSMLSAWVSREPFAAHRQFLELGYAYYELGDYVAAVSVVLPRIEGIVNRAREASGIGATPKFGQLFRGLDRLGDVDVQTGWLGSRIYDGFLGFIDNFFGARFHPADGDAGRRRGRHAHAHGATEYEHYDARYALQLFLVVDALHFLTVPVESVQGGAGTRR